MYDFKTSMPAYRDAQKDINKKQQTVLDAIICLGTCNDHQIAEYLGWSINRVTPRRGELIEQGQIELAFKGKSFETGRNVNFWKVA